LQYYALLLLFFAMLYSFFPFIIFVLLFVIEVEVIESIFLCISFFLSNFFPPCLLLLLFLFVLFTAAQTIELFFQRRWRVPNQV
jgi:hypothetical protein